MAKQTIAEQSVDTRLLVSLISKAAVGDLITYNQMTEAIGRRVEGTTGALISARKAVQRDNGIVFDVVRGVGIKRLTDAEIVALGDTLTGRVRRMARRTIAKVSIADDANLTNDQIVHRNAVVSMAGTIAFLATRGNMNKIEELVRTSADALPVGRTLELFRS